MPEDVRGNGCAKIVFGRVLQVASYAGICGYLIWLAVQGWDDDSATESMYQIIFLDFFGHFLLFLIIPVESQSVRWEWPPSWALVGRVAGYGVAIAIFTFFFQHLAGWPLTLIWIWSIVVSLTDVDSLKSGAIFRVIWVLVSGFLAALVTLMLTGQEDLEIADHKPTLLGMGILYFGGSAVYEVIRGFAIAEKEEQANSIE